MKISIVVTTYNHEKYIEKAIKSVIAQQGDFEKEIIVGDDFSKDNTFKILEKLAKEYKEIKLLSSEKNIGFCENFKRCIQCADGDYIAMCEGDDWYASPYKLQKQIEMLETRKDCVMCSHSYLEYNELKDKYYTIDYQQNFNGDTYKFNELVVRYIWTNFTTYMYRKSCVEDIPDFVWENWGADYGFNMYCATKGNICIIKEPLSVYRVGHGQWSGLSRIEQALENLEYSYISKDKYHKYFGNKYDGVFDERIKLSEKNLKRAKSKDFRNKLRKIFGLKQK